MPCGPETSVPTRVVGARSGGEARDVRIVAGCAASASSARRAHRRGMRRIRVVSAPCAIVAGCAASASSTRTPAASRRASSRRRPGPRRRHPRGAARAVPREHDRFAPRSSTSRAARTSLVGALLCEPVDPSCAAGVIFFNNVGYHRHVRPRHDRRSSSRSRISVASAPGTHRIETPVGVVAVELHDRRRASRCATCRAIGHAAGVTVDVPGLRRRSPATSPGAATGSSSSRRTAMRSCRANVERADRLRLARPPSARRARRPARMARRSTTSSSSAPSPVAERDSRNFVLCPGEAYDRSPCGTGTSAKLACLAADGKLRARRDVAAGKRHRHACSRRRSRLDEHDAGRVLPSITGTAYVTAEATLIVRRRRSVLLGHRARAHEASDVARSSAAASSVFASRITARARAIASRVVERERAANATAARSATPA